MNANGCYEWIGDSIKEDGSFLLLDNVDAEFIIKDVKRVLCNSDKLPAGCLAAEIEMDVVYEGQTVQYKERLTLHQKFAWKLSAFFRSIGLKKRGQECEMNFDIIKGLSGWAHFEVEEFTGRDGDTKKSNRLKRFIDPEEAVKPANAAEDLPF